MSLRSMFFNYDFHLKRDMVYALSMEAYLLVKNNNDANEFFIKLMRKLLGKHYNVAMSKRKINDKHGVINEYIVDMYDDLGMDGLIQALYEDFHISVTKELIEARLKNLTNE